MLFTRKIGAALRGKSTPMQVMLATVLGGLLGFVPGFFLPGDLGGGFAQAPGLILLLLCVALVANANLGVFGLTLLLAKMLSFVLLPVSYMIGTWLLDGPLSGLFGLLVNGKVTAWFGLEYYATTGGLVVGAVFGVVAGLLFNRAIRAIRHKMADVEASSERYQKYAGKWWVRLTAWLFLGKGKGKKTSWQDLNESTKRGLPVRITGLIAAVVLVGAVWVFQAWLSTPLLTQGVRSGLENVNGATVDLETARLGIGDGTLRLEGLAIADSAQLDEDLFAADALVATIDTGELLRRRLVIDEVRSTNARAGSKRAELAVRIPGTEPEPEPAPAGTKTIEDYVKDFEVWQARLEQAREWIEALSGGDEVATAEPTAEEKQRQREAQEDAGLARVVAQHLRHEQPRIVIRKVDIEGIGYSLGGVADKLDVRLRNVSDAPSLLADVLSLSLQAQSDKMRFQLTGSAPGADQLGVAFAYRDLPVDEIFGQLRIGGTPPVAGGTIDLAATGSFADLGEGLSLQLPLQVTMKGATFAFAGMQPTKVDSLLLPIGLSGPLTRPRVSLDDQVLQQALLQAGQQELANFVQGQAGKLLGGAIPVDLTQTPGKIVDDAKGLVEQEAKKAADAARQQAEAEARKKVEEAAKKVLPGGLEGLLPGGGKKKGGG